jgi:hypothetical protein
MKHTYIYVKYFRQTVTESQEKVTIDGPYQHRTETVTDLVRVRRL